MYKTAALGDNFSKSSTIKLYRETVKRLLRAERISITEKTKFYSNPTV